MTSGRQHANALYASEQNTHQRVLNHWPSDDEVSKEREQSLYEDEPCPPQGALLVVDARVQGGEESYQPDIVDCCCFTALVFRRPSSTISESSRVPSKKSHRSTRSSILPLIAPQRPSFSHFSSNTPTRAFHSVPIQQSNRMISVELPKIDYNAGTPHASPKLSPSISGGGGGNFNPAAVYEPMPSRLSLTTPRPSSSAIFMDGFAVRHSPRSMTLPSKETAGGSSMSHPRVSALRSSSISGPSVDSSQLSNPLNDAYGSSSVHRAFPLVSSSPGGEAEEGVALQPNPLQQNPCLLYNGNMPPSMDTLAAVSLPPVMRPEGRLSSESGVGVAGGVAGEMAATLRRPWLSERRPSTVIESDPESR